MVPNYQLSLSIFQEKLMLPKPSGGTPSARWETQMVGVPRCLTLESEGHRSTIRAGGGLPLATTLARQHLSPPTSSWVWRLVLGVDVPAELHWSYHADCCVHIAALRTVKYELVSSSSVLANRVLGKGIR